MFSYSSRDGGETCEAHNVRLDSMRINYYFILFHVSPLAEIYPGEGHGSEGMALTYLHGLRGVYPQAQSEHPDEEAG